jgi:hypothetical protein
VCDEKCIQNFGKRSSEYLGVDGRIILEWILRKCGGEFLEYLSEY